MAGEENLWAAFEAFVRRSHVDPELQERRLYGQLYEASQGAGQSPLRFFAEWSAIHQALGIDYEDSRPLAFAFFYCLQPELQRALVRQKHSIWRPRDVALAAEHLWELRADRDRMDRTTPGSSDRRSVAEEPAGKRPRLDSSLCEKCGKTGHSREACYSEATCSHCHKKGHTEAVCRTRQRAGTYAHINAIRAGPTLPMNRNLLDDYEY